MREMRRHENPHPYERSPGGGGDESGRRKAHAHKKNECCEAKKLSPMGL